MLTSCITVACAGRQRTQSLVSLHRFLMGEGRRKQWAIAVWREGWIPTPLRQSGYGLKGHE